MGSNEIVIKYNCKDYTFDLSGEATDFGGGLSAAVKGDQVTIEYGDRKIILAKGEFIGTGKDGREVTVLSDGAQFDRRYFIYYDNGGVFKNSKGGNLEVILQRICGGEGSGGRERIDVYLEVPIEFSPDSAPYTHSDSQYTIHFPERSIATYQSVQIAIEQKTGNTYRVFGKFTQDPAHIKPEYPNPLYFDYETTLDDGKLGIKKLSVIKVSSGGQTRYESAVKKPEPRADAGAERPAEPRADAAPPPAPPAEDPRIAAIRAQIPNGWPKKDNILRWITGQVGKGTSVDAIVAAFDKNILPKIQAWQAAPATAPTEDPKIAALRAQVPDGWPKKDAILGWITGQVGKGTSADAIVAAFNKNILPRIQEWQGAPPAPSAEDPKIAALRAQIPDGWPKKDAILGWITGQVGKGTSADAIVAAFDKNILPRIQAWQEAQKSPAAGYEEAGGGMTVKFIPADEATAAPAEAEDRPPAAEPPPPPPAEEDAPEPAVPAVPSNGSGGDEPEGRCTTNISSETKTSYTVGAGVISGLDTSGPDINGDGRPDVLTPVAAKVSWDGNQAVCQRVLQDRIQPSDIAKITGEKGTINVTYHEIQALSSAGMESLLGGAPWRQFGESHGSDMLFADAGGFINHSAIQESAPFIPEGKPEEDSSSEDRVEPDGTRVHTSRTSSSRRGRRGTPSITISDIAKSQLRGALKIPTGGGKEAYIGREITITFKDNIPEQLTRYSGDIEGKALKARIVDFRKIFYLKDPSGQYKVAPSSILITIAPKSEENPLAANFSLRLFPSDANYTIEVDGVTTSAEALK